MGNSASGCVVMDYAFPKFAHPELDEGLCLRVLCQTGFVKLSLSGIS